MKPFIFTLLLFSACAFAQVYHHAVDHAQIHDNAYYWQMDRSDLFDELIISWNSARPERGHIGIYVSLKTDSDTWSQWLPYAHWGKSFQKSFICQQVYQDTVQMLANKPGTGFRIKIIGENGARLERFRAIHVFSNHDKLVFDSSVPVGDKSYLVDVKGLSQMALDHPRCKVICSPTSTTAVVRFLKKDLSIDPVAFADSCLDSGFDIFGNWTFSVAEAFNRLSGTPYEGWVERPMSFQTVFDKLKEGLPTVISVRGPLSGSATPYASGHLLVVIGFDSKTEEVICMDPAFDADEKTRVRYNFADLMSAWQRRNNVAYMFAHSCQK